MKGVSTNPKVLLCTVYRLFKRDYWDVAGMPVYKFPRAAAPLRICPGLRFIKQNVPEVEIQEYPLWHEYVAKLKEGWDVVGFSFYQHHIAEIREMIEEARCQGVREIWAGNYGALDYDIPGLVDRVIIGTGEDPVAQAFGYRVRDDEIEHPVMVGHFSIFPGVRHFTYGLLYTSRGCPFKCTFCPSPVFDNRRFSINLESIERVLKYLKKIGINDLIHMDETFGFLPVFTDKLTLLYARYKFRWWAQSRVEIFLRNLDTWYERGMRAAPVGVESTFQRALDNVDKKQRIEDTVEFARRTSAKPGLFRPAYYMVGYENMTLEETIQDTRRFKKLGFDVNGATVLTPYPRTPLWEELDSKYGIFDRTASHYDERHLVWNHPYISPLEMRYLILSLKGFLNKPLEVYRKGFRRLIWDELRQQGAGFLVNNLIKGPLNSLRIDDRKQVYLSPREVTS